MTALSCASIAVWQTLCTRSVRVVITDFPSKQLHKGGHLLVLRFSRKFCLLSQDIMSPRRRNSPMGAVLSAKTGWVVCVVFFVKAHSYHSANSTQKRKRELVTVREIWRMAVWFGCSIPFRGFSDTPSRSEWQKPWCTTRFARLTE